MMQQPPAGLAWRIARYVAVGLMMAWAFQATGLLAGWFVVVDYSPPAAWWMLTEFPWAAGVLSAALLTVLVLNGELLRHEQPSVSHPVWSSTLMLVAASVVALLHALLWLNEAWVVASQGWPLLLMGMVWAFPLALAAGIVLGFVNRFSEKPLGWACLIPPAASALIALVLVEGVVLAEVQPGDQWGTNMLTARFVCIIAAVPVTAGVLWWAARRGVRTMEAAFLGLWLAAAPAHRAAMACLSCGGETRAGAENYRIAAAAVAGVWALAVAIRIIEHVRRRRASQA